MKRPKSERVELSLEALEAILEQARSKPLSEAQIDQLKGVLNTLRSPDLRDCHMTPVSKSSGETDQFHCAGKYGRQQLASCQPVE
jgi:hypothetical protein